MAIPAVRHGVKGLGSLRLDRGYPVRNRSVEFLENILEAHAFGIGQRAYEGVRALGASLQANRRRDHRLVESAEELKEFLKTHKKNIHLLVAVAATDGSEAAIGEALKLFRDEESQQTAQNTGGGHE